MNLESLATQEKKMSLERAPCPNRWTVVSYQSFGLGVKLHLPPLEQSPGTWKVSQVVSLTFLGKKMTAHSSVLA